MLRFRAKNQGTNGIHRKKQYIELLTLYLNDRNKKITAKP